MMGSPFYYDVLFDEGPGDVVFHDCMWSGICTCCIQLLHQDLDIFNTLANTGVDSEKNHQQRNHLQPQNQNATHHHNQHHQQHQQQQHPSSITNGRLSNQQTIPPVAVSHTLCTASNPPPNVQKQLEHQQQTDLMQYVDQSSSSASPATSSSASSSSLSPSGNSPKPIRRREHNDSERKRRDHLRNAFNFLRDQVPRFKSNSKKPPRIQILHEATNYIQAIIKESEELERRMNEERAKHERLKLI